MGLFDNVRCRYRLPDPEAQDFEFQSKSMPSPALENYEIIEDGRLMRESYDLPGDVNIESVADAVEHRVNKQWEPIDFSGELEIHTFEDDAESRIRWYSYCLAFEEGRVVGLQYGPTHGTRF